MDFTAATKLGAVGAAKRRSYGPGGERKHLLKESIGSPMDFQHVGHVGKPLEGQEVSFEFGTPAPAEL